MDHVSIINFIIVFRTLPSSLSAWDYIRSNIARFKEHLLIGITLAEEGPHTPDLGYSDVKEQRVTEVETLFMKGFLYTLISIQTASMVPYAYYELELEEFMK
jgi:hypothetical protein